MYLCCTDTYIYTDKWCLTEYRELKATTPNPNKLSLIRHLLKRRLLNEGLGSSIITDYGLRTNHSIQSTWASSIRHPFGHLSSTILGDLLLSHMEKPIIPSRITKPFSPALDCRKALTSLGNSPPGKRKHTTPNMLYRGMYVQYVLHITWQYAVAVQPEGNSLMESCRTRSDISLFLCLITNISPPIPFHPNSMLCLS